METSEAVATRRSVRAYHDRPVSFETIQTILDQARKTLRACDVRALADEQEVRLRTDGQGLEATEKAEVLGRRQDAWNHLAHRLGDRSDVLRSRAATATENVGEARLGKLAKERCRLLG